MKANHNIEAFIVMKLFHIEDVYIDKENKFRRIKISRN